MDATQAVNDSFLESDEEEKEEKTNEGRQPLAKLCILKNDHVPEREYPLFMGDNLLGRDAVTCTLPILSPSVSKQHASIRISVHQRRGSHSGVDIEAVVKDLGSMNGTRIGRVKLIPNISYPLSEGNRLLMADMPCQYLRIRDTNEDAGAWMSGDGVSLLRDSLDRRDAIKVNASQQSQASAKVSHQKRPAQNRCLSFESTPVQLKGTLVPESESDSDEERPRTREGSRKLQGSRSSTTRSTFVSLANKTISESPYCEDGTPVTPLSSTRENPRWHVSFSNDEPDVDVRVQQKKNSLTIVNDSDEEEAGVVENGQARGREQLKNKASFTEEESLQLSTSTGSSHAFPKLNMDSDTDLGEDGGEAEPVPDPKTNAVCFHLDSDTDVDEDDASAPPMHPKGGDSQPDTSPKKTDAAPPPLSGDFHLDSDTDVEEEPDNRETAVIGDISESDDEQALNAQANVCDSAAGSNEHPCSSPVSNTPSSATRGITAAAAQAESDAYTDLDESSAPPVDQDSDTDVEEERITSSGVHPPHQQNCSTPVQMSGGLNSTVGSAAMFSCLDSQDEEDFVVAETQPFILQSQEPIQTCNVDSGKASSKDTEELPSRGASFQLGLSDSSHLQNAVQALALESTQAFVSETQACADTASLGNDFNMEATQAYEAPASSSRMYEENQKTNLALQETQSFISQPSSESEEEPKEDSETQPFDAPSSASIALAETQLMSAFQGDECPARNKPVAPLKLKQIAKQEDDEALQTVTKSQPRGTRGTEDTVPVLQKQKQLQLDEARLPFTPMDSVEKQPRAAGQTEDSNGDEQFLVLPKSKVHLDEVMQPNSSSYGLVANRQSLSLAPTQPMALSENEESDDEDSIPVLAKRKVQLDKRVQPIRSTNRLVANRQTLSLAPTQPMALSDSDESDEDSIPVLAEENVQLGKESSNRSPSDRLPLGLAATQPMATSENEESENEDSIPVLTEEKVPLNKEMQLHMSSYSLRANRQTFGLAATQPMATSDNEETDMEDSSIPNEETQPNTSSCLVPTQLLSLASTQPMSPRENKEINEEEDTVPFLRKKRTARRLQINDESQSLSSTLEMTPDSWNDANPTKDRAEGQRSSDEPLPVTPIQTEDEETQPNLDTLSNAELGPCQVEEGKQLLVNSKVSSTETYLMDTFEDDDPNSEILIPGSRRRKAKPLRIEDETQSLRCSQGEEGTPETPSSSRSTNKSGTSISNDITAEDPIQEKEESKKRQTRSRVGKSRPEGEIQKQEKNLLEVQNGKQKKPQGKNAQRARKKIETEVVEDRERNETLETEAKEEKPQITQRAQRATRRTIAALPSAAPHHGDVAAKRTRLHSNSSNSSSEVSTSGTQGCRARRAKTFKGSTSIQPLEQDNRDNSPLGVLSRSSSTNSLASEMSCSSLGSRRGRGSRRPASGRKTEPGSSLAPPISSQTPPPKPPPRGGRKAGLAPTDLLDENAKGKPNSQQMAPTRGRHRANIKKPLNEEPGPSLAPPISGQTPPPKAMPRRGRKTGVSSTELADENAKEKPNSQQEAATRGRRRANVKKPSNEVSNSAGETNIRGRDQKMLTSQASDEMEPKDKGEGRKRLLKAELQDENPEPKRRAKSSHAQEARTAKDSTCDATSQNGSAPRAGASVDNEQAQTPISSKRRTRDAPVKSSPVTSRMSSAYLSPSLRTRDAHHAYKVLFTGVVDEAGERVLTALGGFLADGIADMNCLVTDRVRRTVKFLCAVAKGIPIVNMQWLNKSGKAGSLLPTDAFIVSDAEQEKKFNFSLQESLRLASNQPLLQGYKIHITKSVKPEPIHMRDIISCSGATFLPKMPSSHKPDTLVISCPEDLPLCRAAIATSIPVVSAEFLLSGILQHKVDLNAHKLSGPPNHPQPDVGRRRTSRVM